LKTFLVFLVAAGCSFAQTNVPLGTAANFGVLASTSVTNTGASVIAGSVGVSPAGTVTGFPPGVVTAPGTIEINDAASGMARNALITAYGLAGAETTTQNLTGQNLGGKTLGPGVYTFNGSAALNGTLTLTGSGFYIFQVNGTLTTAAGSSVVANAAQATNVFWQVGSSATLGSASTFAGNLLALGSVTDNTGGVVGGRLFSISGSVSLADDGVTYPPALPPGGVSATPAPSSLILVLIGLACVMLYQSRHRMLQLIAKS
jgi:hypothetical protein